jgi:uncharacterized protein (TIGR00369 family)
MINRPDIGAFGQLLGFEVVEWRDGFVRMAMRIQPQHLNRSGVLHGGIVSTLLDSACGYAATYCPVPGHVRFVVSLSLTTHFTGQARDGTLTTIARVRGGGRRIVMTSGEVLDEAGKLIGFGDGVLRYRSGSEDPAGIPYEPPAGSGFSNRS